MPRGKKADVATLPDIRVGDRVVITAKGSRNGEEGTVAEVDTQTGVRLNEWGWLPFDDVEVLHENTSAPDAQDDAAARAAAQSESEVATLVDGQPAKLVFDGCNAGVGDHDEPMIKPTLEDLVRSLALASQTFADATIAKKRANETYNDAQGAFNAVAHEIVTHYGSVEQLKLDITSSSQPAPQRVAVHEDDAEESDDENAEENDEETETVGAGVGGSYEGSVRSFPGQSGPE